MFLYQNLVNRSLWSKNQTNISLQYKNYPKISTGTKTIVRSGHFAETLVIVVIVAASFPQNANDGNDTLFPQYFPLNINVGLCDCMLIFWNEINKWGNKWKKQTDGEILVIVTDIIVSLPQEKNSGNENSLWSFLQSHNRGKNRFFL